MLDDVRAGAGGARLTARARAGTAECARCGQPAAWVHSRYRRHLADAPIGGRPVEVVLRIPQFFCDNTGCPLGRSPSRSPG